MISRISKAIQAQNISPGLRGPLQRDVSGLKTLSKAIRRPKKVLPKAQKRLSRAKSGLCTLCGRPFPHLSADWRWHGKKMHVVKAQKYAWAWWKAHGYEDFWKKSVKTRYDRAIIRRTAIFREIAPRSAAHMTVSEIEATINRCRNPKDGTMRCTRNFLTWIRKNYA